MKTEKARTAICVGTSKNPDSAEASRQAAQMAVNMLPPGESAAWALAFSGERHDNDVILRGFRDQLGDIPIVGGAAVGTITSDSLGYTSYECSVAVFPSSIPKPAIVVVEGLERGETDVGLEMGSKLRDIASEDDTVLLFYDSIRSSPPPVLYVGSRLMDGIYQSLADKTLNIVGAGTIGDHQMSGSFIFDGVKTAKHAVVAAILPPEIHSRTTIMHGCVPVSAFLEITKIDGATLYELDGRPALELLQEMLGSQLGSPNEDNLSLIVTIGEKHGDPFAPYDEVNYVNRLILNSNPADGSVTLFEADFHVGTKIQIMSRDNQLVIASARTRTQELLASLGEQKPAFALYIDCAGRASAFCGSEIEEASIIQTELGPETPLLGFYSGVEIAPLLGRSRPLDWTGVLTLFTLD